MSLAERFAAPPAPDGKKFCQAGRALERLGQEGPTDDPTSDYVVLVTVLADRRWSSTAIALALEKEGLRTSERHLRDHRAGRHNERNCFHPNVGVIK